MLDLRELVLEWKNYIQLVGYYHYPFIAKLNMMYVCIASGNAKNETN